MEPATFITDYETALRNALNKVYPATKLTGCWFHYCQALRRFVAKKDSQLLQYMQYNSADARQIFHYFMALPLLPATSIYDIFEDLKKKVKEFDKENRFSTFIKYFEKQWMLKVRIFL